MKFIPFVFLLSLGLYSCHNLDCDKIELEKSVVGYYENITASEAIQTLEIRDDGSFIHKYHDIGDIETNKGFWSKKAGKCEIVFTQWKNLGRGAELDGCSNGCTYFVYVENGVLVFSIDLEELNFKKIK